MSIYLYLEVEYKDKIFIKYFVKDLYDTALKNLVRILLL